MKKLLMGILVLCAVSIGGYAMYMYTAKPIYYVLVGPPGSGKGTLATKLGDDQGLPVITTSQVLKQSIKGDTPIANEIKRLMDSGQFVSDDIINEVLAQELQKPEYANGAIFDGFPRTMGQTAFFKQNKLQIDLLIILAADDDVIIKRMEGRRIHKPSGRMYHIEHMPPQIPGQDDVTGEELIQRPDDKEEIVRARLEDYHQLTTPIIVWAQDELMLPNGVVSSMVKIDASQEFSAVWGRLQEKL